MALLDDRAARIHHAIDDVRVHAVAAVGEHRVAARHLQHRHRACAQRHRQIGRVPIGVEAEAGDVLLRVLRTNRAQDPHRHQVLRFLQRAAHRHRAVIAAAVVLRLPHLAARVAGRDRERRVVDDGRRRETLVHRRRVDERLEARTRLAPGLRDVVELAAVEIEATHHRVDRARLRIQRDETRGHFRQLRDRPLLRLRVLDHTDHRARAQLDLGLCIVRQGRLCKAQAVACQVDRLTGQHRRAHQLGCHAHHHGRLQIVAVRVFQQGVVDGLFTLLCIGGQVDERFRAAIAVTALVIENAAAHGLIGDVLVGLAQRGVDVQPARVGFFAVLRVHELAYHFGHVFGVHVELMALATHRQLLIDSLGVLLRRDVVQVAHALQDVLLTHLGALGVHHGVVRRWRLGQAGQHGRFGQGDVLDVLAEVDLLGAGKAVCTLAQVDLVHVQLEDLILCQARLDLVREQDLVNLARVRLLARQEEVARHLHRDGRRTLRETAMQVRQARAQHADEVDAAVFVEAVVFDRQDRALHHIGHLRDRYEAAALLTEFTDEDVIGGVDAQRNLRTVIGDGVERRQVGRGDEQGIAQQQRPDDPHRNEQAEHPEKQSRPQRAAGFGRLGRSWGGLGSSHYGWAPGVSVSVAAIISLGLPQSGRIGRNST